MTVASPGRNVGWLLREWRRRRGLSQLDLALEAEVSSRHLSFVETGRAQPSRELLLHLAEQLEVPLRDRNTLLLAAGYAPVYQETKLDAEEMAPVRTALQELLSGHEPFPAVAVDRRWNLLMANRPALSLFTTTVAPGLLEPPVNALRVTLHPEGLAPRIGNFGEYSAHLLNRLRRQAAAAADPMLVRLAEELRGYPGVATDWAASGEAPALYVPLYIKAPAGEDLVFFSTITTFGTALDITLEELAVESFFPADEATRAYLRAQAGLAAGSR